MPDLVDHRSYSTLVAQWFPPAHESAAAARRRLRDATGGRFPPDVIDTAALLTTELVSNAIACSDTPFLLRVASSDEGALHVAVTDSCPDPPRLEGTVDVEAEGGRGLLLVDALAHDWGTAEADPRGKVVWFSLAT